MQPAGKAHTMLQIAIPLFTHLFRKFLVLVFFVVAGTGSSLEVHWSAWTPCSYATERRVT